MYILKFNIDISRVQADAFATNSTDSLFLESEKHLYKSVFLKRLSSC